MAPPLVLPHSFDPTRNKWVSVTWMPHTTLAQTSHVCLSIRSAHASLGHLHFHEDEINGREWQVRVQVFGVAGIPLAPVSCATTAAPVISRRRSQQSSKDDTSQLPKMQTLHPTVTNASHDCKWDYVVHLPIRWRDLPRDAFLQYEIIGVGERVEYAATMPFFSQYGRLTTGLQKLKLHRPDDLSDCVNYGLVPLQPRNKRNENKGLFHKSNDQGDENDPLWKASRILDEIARMEERKRNAPTIQQPFGEIPTVPWLDDLQKKRSMQIISDTQRDHQLPIYDDDGAQASLIVEFPTFEIPIMHEETFYSLPQHGASGAVAPLDLCVYRKQLASDEETTKKFDPLQLVPFLDYESEHDNPVEDKYRTLAHDLLRGLVDPALKPDREQRDRLAAIIDSPSHHPTREEKDLLWRFRFSLVDNRRALTKFLLAVDWTVESEVVQAAELLEQWRKRSPIEVTDALKLLGKHVAFQTSLVRAYAIDTLAAAPDSELRLYLLQLVQALKYETVETSEFGSVAGPSRASTGASSPQVSSLATFLISRASANLQLANYLYWYLKVELENPNHGARYREVFVSLEAKLSRTKFTEPEIQSSFVDDIHSAKAFKSIVDSVSKLGSSFRGDHGPFEKERSTKKQRERTMWDVLIEQDKFISGVLDVQLRSRDIKGKKDAKETELKSLLSKEGLDRNSQRLPVPLPSSPEVFVNGVRPETAKMFKSALYPAVLEFHTESRVESMDSSARNGRSKGDRALGYKAIVKTGDDLRQDQLIIMMIQLMDRLLKRAALDLCLSPYSILATSPTSGLVEFVDNSMPVSAILSTYNGSIMQFLQSSAGLKGAKYDINPEAMSNYVRSCAGYCVITYLLGVGDRHLDNIMLRGSGHFFHIDFGFILGRDPKPLPPAFRLTRELVDGMGGIDSSEYRQFCSLSCQAFNALRKSAGLVLNLLHLMSDAGIEDLSNNPSADAEGVIAKVEERFRLDLSDEQAERYFLGLINDCLAALAPRVMDVIHAFAVARR